MVHEVLSISPGNERVLMYKMLFLLLPAPRVAMLLYAQVVVSLTFSGAGPWYVFALRSGNLSPLEPV